MTRRYLLPLLVLLTAPALAQTDSLRVSYSTEPPDSSESRWREPYRYLTRANVEEKTLVKLGFGPNVGTAGGLGFFMTLNSEAVVEHKLRPAWSVLGGFNFGVGYQKNSPSSGFPTDKPNYGLAANLVARVGFRNYYAIGQRMRNRKSADNFSNNYWGAELWVPVLVQGSYRSILLNTRPGPGTGQPLPQIERQVTYWGGRVQPQVYWGIQRRLGRRGYLDFNVSVRYGPSVFRRYVAQPQSFDAWRSLPNGRPVFSEGNFSIHPTLRIGLGW